MNIKLKSLTESEKSQREILKTSISMNLPMKPRTKNKSFQNLNFLIPLFKIRKCDFNVKFKLMKCNYCFPKIDDCFGEKFIFIIFIQVEGDSKLGSTIPKNKVYDSFS
jgi:hypothetical protein